MKKKDKALSILAAVAMLVSILIISTVSVSAEQQGSIALEYNHVNPTENGGTQEDTHVSTDGATQGSNTPGAGQPNEQTQSNVKTGDVTASVAGGVFLVAILSACTAWFAIMKKKKVD